MPSPIITNLQEDEGDREAGASSPMDSQLMQRKAERQQQGHKAILRPSHLSEVTAPDSPGLQKRINELEQGEDPTQNSSPVGAALLAKKAARGKASALGDPALTETAFQDDQPEAPPPPGR